MPRRVARARTFPSRRGNRPGGTWGRAVTNAATVAGTTKSTFLTFVLSTAGIGETIRRTVGGILVRSDQVATAESYSGAVGAVIITDAAAAIGSTAIPGPVTEADDDGWFLWQGFAGEQGVDSSKSQLWFPFDSRAMRRVSEGFQIAFVIETAGADGITFNMAVSLYATRN